MIDNLWQFLSILTCIYALFYARRMYLLRSTVSPYSVLVALPAIVTGVFYGLTLFTEWTGAHDWASPVHLFTLLMLAAGANRMSRSNRNG